MVENDYILFAIVVLLIAAFLKMLIDKKKETTKKITLSFPPIEWFFTIVGQVTLWPTPHD